MRCDGNIASYHYTLFLQLIICHIIKMHSWHCMLLILLPMLLPTMSSLHTHFQFTQLVAHVYVNLGIFELIIIFKEVMNFAGLSNSLYNLKWWFQPKSLIKPKTTQEAGPASPSFPADPGGTLAAVAINPVLPLPPSLPPLARASRQRLRSSRPRRIFLIASRVWRWCWIHASSLGQGWSSSGMVESGEYSRAATLGR
jgi:hypothetical protein